MADGPPIHAGWLTKRAVRTASKDNWKRRYVVLTAKALSYYESDRVAAAKGGKPKHSLPLSETTAVRPCAIYGPHELEVCFSPDVIFYATAESADDAATWIVSVWVVARLQRRREPWPTIRSVSRREGASCSGDHPARPHTGSCSHAGGAIWAAPGDWG